MAASEKHGGGSVMVWGCFGGCAVRGIIRIEGYKTILSDNVVPFGTRLIGENSRQNCVSNMVKVMVRPPQSPDLNIIELLWDEFLVPAETNLEVKERKNRTKYVGLMCFVKVRIPIQIYEK